jgi:hypothetical protein
MLGKHSALEKSMEDILIDLMDEKVMSVGIQASSTGGLQESPSTEKRSKHHDDLDNAR